MSMLLLRPALKLVAVVVAATAIPMAAPAEAAQNQAAQKKAAKQKAAKKRAAAERKTCSESARGTLVVVPKADELVVDVAFKRETGTRHMTLVYDVTGCTLDDEARRPAEPPAIYPPKTGDAIPDGAIQLARDPSIENGGKRYLVPLTIQSSAIDPGTYSGLVETRSSVLNPVRSAVTVSRSEDNFWIPIAWGLLGAVGGFGLFSALRLFKRNDLRVNGWLLALAAVISLVVGAVAALTTSYLNQDVWTSGQNAWAAVVIGFTASTSGVMTALLAAVWSDPPDPDGPAPVRGGGADPTLASGGVVGKRGGGGV
jgi:hypothetical protein